MEKSLIEGAKEVEESLHRLPCKIVYDGKAPVNTYFIPTTIEGTLSSTFRGRGLIGRKEAVPMKYSGKILVDRESQLACNSTFDQLTLWEHGCGGSSCPHRYMRRRWPLYYVCHLHQSSCIGMKRNVSAVGSHRKLCIHLVHSYCKAAKSRFPDDG
ncbi:hypothetical protein DFS34DRAFT_298668 [Phlyctochytrium arcticum]|nr:hypothetical protein DFS34DRAFT_298668 [Phlyctochytrium arcticum]